MKKNAQYIGVDEKYIPENEKYVNNEVNEEVKDSVNDGLLSVKKYLVNKDNQEKIKNASRKGFKILKVYGLGYLMFFGLIMVITITMFIMIILSFGKINNSVNDSFIKNANIPINIDGDIEVNVYNAKFDLYEGSQSGLLVNKLLENVVANNTLTKNQLIKVTYNGKTYINANDIEKLKPLFNKTKEYEVSLDYDSSGFIIKVNIEQL